MLTSIFIYKFDLVTVVVNIHLLSSNKIFIDDFEILPIEFLGNSLTNRISFGILYEAS